MALIFMLGTVDTAYNNTKQDAKGVTLPKPEYTRLDMKKVNAMPSRNTTAEEALKDVIPIEWSDDVKNGRVKVELVWGVFMTE